MNIEELSTEGKKSVLKALASGLITKHDLKDRVVLEILSNNYVTLVRDEFLTPEARHDDSKATYRHNGKKISKAEFDRLERLYEALRPHMPASILITTKDSGTPLANAEEADS